LSCVPEPLTVASFCEPLRLLALYNPGGAERALIDLPDYRSTAPGQVLGLRRVDP
jgi:hypothetical protein